MHDQLKPWVTVREIFVEVLLVQALSSLLSKEGNEMPSDAHYIRIPYGVGNPWL